MRNNEITNEINSINENNEALKAEIECLIEQQVKKFNENIELNLIYYIITMK